MDQADSPQLQGDRSIRFCTRVLLNMRYKWHRRWLVRAAAGRGGRKEEQEGLAVCYCGSACSSAGQTVVNTYNEDRGCFSRACIHPCLSLCSVLSTERGPLPPALSALPHPLPLAAGGAGCTGAAVPQGRDQAGAAPVVLLHRPTRGAGSPLLVRSAGCRGSSLASGGSRSSCFRSRYVNQHAAPSWLSLWMAFLTRWSWHG